MVIILNFKTFLKDNRNARLIFGKKELEIVLKQLEGLQLKQSERNRLSRYIRPKFEFIKEAAKFEDEFKLKKSQNNKKMIERALGVILNDEFSDKIKAILLFGSFADNSFTSRSDIDICVIFKEDLSIREATQFRIRVSGQLPEKIDVQVFNTLPQKVKREIARNHKVLYKNKGYDNINFSIRHLKDQDYFMRMKKIFGAEA